MPTSTRRFELHDSKKLLTKACRPESGSGHARILPAGHKTHAHILMHKLFTSTKVTMQNNAQFVKTHCTKKKVQRKTDVSFLGAHITNK
jgi:hypothetical protein